MQIYRQLIQAKLPAEIYFQTDKLQKQLKFANQKGIAFVVLQGPDERGNGNVTIKQMQSGTQKTIPQGQLVEYIQGFYV